MSSIELTSQGDVFSLSLPKGKTELLHFDRGKPKARAHGLALRLRAGGTRKWVYFYRWGGWR